MSLIISVHSFRGGTGKSNTTASLAALLAQDGRRVGVIDTDIQSPGIHVLFGLDEEEMKYALNDYLWGDCTIEQAAVDVTERLGPSIKGRIFLIPSSLKAGEIARVLREGYDMGLLSDGFQELVSGLSLDVLLIDTHPGLNEETLLSIAISDALALIMRPDSQDYQGTGVTVDVAQKLGVPRLLLVVNKVPAAFSEADVLQRVQETYNCEVGAVLPHSDEMMTLASSDIFALRFPDHLVTKRLRALADRLVGKNNRSRSPLRRRNLWELFSMTALPETTAAPSAPVTSQRATKPRTISLVFRVLFAIVIAGLLPLIGVTVSALNGYRVAKDQAVSTTSTALDDSALVSLQLRNQQTASEIGHFLDARAADARAAALLPPDPVAYTRFATSHTSELWYAAGTASAPTEVRQQFPLFREIVALDASGRPIAHVVDGAAQPATGTDAAQFAPYFTTAQSARPRCPLRLAPLPPLRAPHARRGGRHSPARRRLRHL